MKFESITQEDDHFLVSISNKHWRFHYFWLRDNAPQCRSSNGQKLHESNMLDPKVRPVAFSHDDTEIIVHWSDGTGLAYPVQFLWDHAYDGVEIDRVLSTHWGAEIADTIRVHDYSAVKEQSQALFDWLHDAAVLGFSLLANAPTREGAILDVVKLFGYVRCTNYGELFDVRSEDEAVNLAYTDQPLSVHTDNPYRHPCPSLQLLHCLVQSDTGGQTALVDGFKTATQLQRLSPKAFGLLSRHPVQFQYRADEINLDAWSPIIRLDTEGNVEAIRINNRSMAPPRLNYDLVPQFYDALFQFREILEAEASQYRFRMRPGDLVLFDNERVLHGRIGTNRGHRHLQGCYADRDGLLSTLKGLAP